MGFGISLPSLSDIGHAVRNGVTGAATSVRDFGSAAVAKTEQLASDGLDLGRGAVNAVESIDVRQAASVVREKISEGTEAARNGIKVGVEWAGQRTHEAADFARDHVPGGDNMISNGIRGAITAQEDMTRFSLGVVGGVTREAVGLVGTAGELGTTAMEMQLSPEASAEYGQKILDGAKGAAEATGTYIGSVAKDPTRLGGDVSHIADASGKWVGGQVDRYQQAFRDGKGFETVGMDVGTVATYVVPIGGGPARGALTAAVRGGTEAAARGGAEALARGGAETLARDGTEAIARDGATTIAHTAPEPLKGLSDIARRTGASEGKLQEVIDLGRDNRPPPADYLSAERIAEHRAAFDDGASRFSLQKNVDKYGLGQRDGTTFVMTRAEADQVLHAAGGDMRKLEEALGLPKGQLDGEKLVRVDFPPESLDDLNVRMPSGNEAGANDQWLPGGFLPSGANEAVLDGGRATADQYAITTVK